MIKKILKICAGLIGVTLVLLVGLVVFLSVTEYNPQPIQAAEEVIPDDGDKISDSTLTIYSWNIGYGGLGKESDFFMDGGNMVYPPNDDAVDKNLRGIIDFIDNSDADAWLFQEVDISSAHTDNTNEFKLLADAADGSGAFAYNYKCEFVPIPLPPIGKVASGVATVTDFSMEDNAQRIALPCPFKWPVSTANLKRCLLVTRAEIEGSDKELVLVNLHLEAYESGEGRIAQTKQLLSLMEEEYKKGNYVIAGGDFNQTFPGALDVYPIMDAEKWTPGILENESLSDGWQYAYDSTSPTCRLLDKPYDGTNQLYVIDGFILSPNIELKDVKTVSLDFEYSDHNPVKLDIELIP